MAKKRNDQRRVQPTLTSADESLPKGMAQAPVSEAGLKKQLEFYGKIQEQVVDISTQMEGIFNTQQQITQEADRQFGIEKKVLNSLGVYANQVKMLSLEKKLLTKHSLEESNIIKKTISDYQEYNQAAAGVSQKAKELSEFRRKQVPFEDKIRGIQQEITNMQADQTKGLTKAQQERIKNLKTSEDQWKMLSKQEQVNKRIEKIQGNITELMEGQGSAASKIFTTLKDIVTNPLTLFTGLLAVGLSRFETMRQRGVQLGEEQDRINKKLAGAGPFQDKIIQKATLIRDRFYEMGEGFASSMEGSVDAIVALGDQFGKIDYVTGDLVKTMAELKLSIGLSDEASAKVLDNFMTVNGLSSEAAISMTDITYQMAEQAGLNPQQVFQDIAAASGDTLATFSGSADELAKSAVTARRLGLTLDDMANVSKGLLDFETSIEKEMEAQLITGIDLNLQKARMLAMQGDEAGAMEEVMKQVGGLDRFNKLQPLQQRALAEAVNMTVGQLQKTTKQRELEAEHATKKYDLVEKQFSLAQKALPLLNKLDVGLGVMERIAVTLGDLFLDVFGTSLKDLEKDFFAFINSPVFKTGFKNLLHTIKGIILGIKDAVMGVMGFINKMSGGAIGSFLTKVGGTDLSGGYKGAEDMGNVIGKVLVGAYLVKKTLGTFINPMIVKVKGGLMGGSSGIQGFLGKLFGGGAKGPLTKAGLPDMRYAANRGLGGAAAGGSKFMGMNLGSAMGGTAGTTATSLGGTGLGMAGAALGAAGVIGSVGMGVYDVATLSDRATSRDKATARGGLGGALGGAATGALIGSAVPVIGTLLGAGIGGILGYFGGRAVGSMDNFRDDLDRSRDYAKEAAENREEVLQTLQQKFKLDAMRGSMQVGKAFRSLSGGMKELTGKKMKEFGNLLIEQGVIGKKAFKQFAEDGKITMSELQKIQSTVGQNIMNLGNEQYKKAIKKIDDTGEFDLLPVLKEQVTILHTMADDFNIDAAIQQLGLDRTVIGMPTVDQRGVTYPAPEDVKFTSGEITKKMLKDLVYAKTSINDITSIELNAMLKAVNKSLDGKIGEETGFVDPDDLTVAFKAAINLFASSRETQASDLQGKLDNKVVTAVEKQTEELTTTDLSTKTKKDIGTEVATAIEAKVIEPLLDPDFLLNMLEQQNVSDRYANGGVTYGPSHAQGGIPTRFGELEGGEAIINKRSTAMFRNELSDLNVAGGGTSFGDGGVTRKFGEGGMVDPADSPTVQQYNHDVMGVWTKSIPAYWVHQSNLGRMDITPGRRGTGPKKRGNVGHFTQTPMALDVVDKYSGLFGKPNLYADDGHTYAGYNTNTRRKRHDTSYKQQDVMGSDQLDHMLKNDKNNADSIPNMLQDMSTMSTKESMYDKMRLATSPVAEGVANAQQLGAEWVGTFLALGLGATSGVLPQLLRLGYQGAKTGFSASTGAISGGGQQLLTGANFLQKFVGGMRMTGGLSGMYGMGVGANNIVRGKASTKDLANVFMGGHGNTLEWLKAFTKAGYYTSKGSYGSALMQFLPKTLGNTLGLTKSMSGMMYDSGKGAIGLPDMIGGAKQGYGMLKNWFTGGSEDAGLLAETGFDIESVKPNSLAGGGVLPHSPITKVNDMILTKDGQMIETAADDNIIAKKGSITQTPAGGGDGGRMEQLLENILMAIQAGGDTYIDGAKVSAAINTANYNV